MSARLKQVSAPSRRRTGVLILLCVLGFVFAGGAAAMAYWTISVVDSAGSDAISSADSLPAGQQPILSGLNGGNVTIDWAASATVSEGHAASAYTINRYSSPMGSTPVAATGGCAGQVSALSCTEQAVPAGTWYYAVTPVLDNWKGTEGRRSSAITVSPSTLSITSGQNLTTLPGTLTGGALTSFGSSENVTFHLDSATGTTLLTTPSTVSTGDDGQANGISVAIPSGIADGVHTLVAVGNTSGLTAASNSFTVSVPSTLSITSGQNLTTLPGTLTGGALTSFGSSENVTFHLDSATGTTLLTTPSTVSTGDDGQANGISVAIPSGIADGVHTLVAVGNTSGLTAASNSFTVSVPSTLSITSGQNLTTLPGTLTSGALTSFGSSENVTFHLDSATGTTLLTTPSTVSTGDDGQANGISVAIPSGIADGVHTLVAVGNTSGLTAASNSFTVSVPSTLSITSGQNLTTLPGTLTSGALTSFGSSENVTFHLDSATGTTLLTTPSTVSTGDDGQANGISVAIPSGIADGVHTLVAVGNTSGLTAASNSFTVSVPSTLSITSGQNLTTLPGTLTSGALTSFGSSENVTFHLDSATGTTLLTTPSTVSTGDDGQANGISVAIPSGIADGVHTLVAVGNTSGLTAASNSFTVSVFAASDLETGNCASLRGIVCPIKGNFTITIGWSDLILINLMSLDSESNTV